jgi:hypothetical protein
MKNSNTKNVNGKNLQVVNKETQKTLSIPTKKPSNKELAKVTALKVTATKKAAEEVKTKKTNLERKTELESKESKSTFDYVKLANVSDKIEDKTISKVYKKCTENEYLNQITGLTEKPTFEEFKSKMPLKDSYSNWDGYKALAKFNVKNNTATKVKRQNKTEAKK